MKKILIICIVILGLNQNIFSQDTEKNVTIQTSPFLLFSDFIISDISDTLFIMDLEVQFKLSKYSNISVTLSFLYNDSGFDSDNYTYEESYFQVGFKPMYIYRPFGTGIKGFFIGIYPNLGFRYEVDDDESTLYTEVGFGLNLGYKWVLGSGFTLQLGGGIGKTFSFPTKPTHDAFINSDGRITVIRSDFSIDFKMGYSF